jgi:cytidylate kinase
MKITINGTPGSGKTTLAKAIAKRLGLKFYSSGQIRRDIAKIFGLNIDEFNKLGEKHAFTDKLVDEMVKTILKNQSFVLDARLGWWLFPESIKIFVTSSLDIAAERIFKASKKGERKSEMTYRSIEEVKREIKQRMRSDERRYRKYYKIRNIYELRHYDIILDTTGMSKKKMIEECLNAISSFPASRA